MSYFDPANQIIEHFNDLNGVSDNKVLSLCSDSEGNYWIGTAEGGLDKLNYSTLEFKNFSFNPKNQSTLSSNSIQALYEDNNGILWIGNFDSGLDAYNPETKKIKLRNNKHLK